MAALWTEQIAVAHQVLVDCRNLDIPLEDALSRFRKGLPDLAEQAGQYLCANGYAMKAGGAVILTGAGRRKACELQGRMDGISAGWLEPAQVYRE